jgi:hypothetical protein
VGRYKDLVSQFDIRLGVTLSHSLGTLASISTENEDKIQDITQSKNTAKVRPKAGIKLYVDTQIIVFVQYTELFGLHAGYSFEFISIHQN